MSRKIKDIPISPLLEKPAQPTFDARDTQYNLPIDTDCISRQAAINKILGQPPEPHYPSWYAEQIKELPSVQPEIIRCKDCDWWTKQEDNLQGRCALLQMYPTGGWFCGNARRREVTT